MQITYLGHSCFEIITNNKKILIDPFLVMSPNYITQNVTDIFVSHGHGDHLGNAIEISRKTGAQITAIFELANYCANKGVNSNGIGLGSWVQYDWGEVIAVPAFHSSSTPEGNYGGNPCGFVFKIEDKIIYHAGDTCLNQEMKTIGELYPPDYALLPVGGHYTMDIEHAIVAMKWLKAKTLIPMHYNTFDAISIDINDLILKSQNLGFNLKVLSIGEKV